VRSFVLLGLLVSASAGFAASVDDLTWSITDGEVTITDCDTAASGVLSIPAVIEGYPVTSIARSAFLQCNALTRITIPDGVTSIGGSAFSSCSSLISIVIPDGVTIIDGGTFSYCSSLTSIVIPDGITSIGSAAFFDCSSLTRIVIPRGVTIIENSAFSGCASLTSITIPDSVTSIGAFTFSECTSLTDITIPDSVSSVGQAAFSSCTNLTSITIPDEVTRIENYTFSGCNSLTSITIGFGVTKIGQAAFGDCVNLTAITIPNDVTSIGNRAFSGCNSLTDIVFLPKVAPSLGQEVFLNISEGSTFSVTSGATGYTDPFGGVAAADPDGDGISDINDAFPNDATETNDTDGDGVGDNTDAFPNDSTETVDTDGDGVGDNSDNFSNFDDRLITFRVEGASVTIASCNTSTSGDVIIPDSIDDLPVTSIGNFAFRGCASLNAITIPEGVTSIGRFAFSECASLTTITIPEGVTSIGDNAFRDCANLMSIALPDQVSNIGESSFYNCSSLETIDVGAGNSSYIFTDGILFNSEMTLLHTYLITKSETVYSIPESVTSIGAGAFAYSAKLISVNMHENVANIGQSAFENCGSLKNFFMEGPPPSANSSSFVNLAPNAIVNVQPLWRSNYGAAGETWYGLFVVESEQEDCDTTALTNTITTLVTQLAQKDAQIAQLEQRPTQAAYDQVVQELNGRPTLEDFQDLRAGSIVLTPTVNGTVILRMMIEESSDLSIWEQSGESVEVELPLAEGKKFLRFSLGE